MVMEAPPTPQCVGREFVRQYYTLLNQAPVHLHRFYSDNSMFIHGGLDVPNRETKQVIGQTQIHEHIQQLNFRDCHAKISQVDAQATLGNGVVVQVSGELSNGGQPMRRFTQTFVLAAETPKKYYVHNDIFRYQDMLITDEEIDQADLSRSDGEDDQEESVEINQNGQPVYYNNSSASPEVNGSHVHEQDHQFPPPPNVTQPVMDVIQSTTQPTTYSAPVPPPTTQFPTVKQVEESVKPIESVPPSPPKEEPPSAWSETYDAADNTVEESSAISAAVVAEPSPPTYEPEPPVVVSNEPKTYANLLKSGSNMMSSSHVDTTYHQHKPPVSPPPSCTVPKPSELNSSRDLNRTSLPHPQNARGARPGPSAPRGGSNMRGMSRDRPLQQSQPRASFSEDNDNDRPVFASRHSTGGGGNFNRENGGLTSDGVVFNDNQQLFMGNIPIEASDDELRLLFGRFGTILDLTVFRKPNQKGPNKVPYFGFVIFEDPNTIQKVLQRRPIYFPDNNAKNPSSVKLNVEEKKKRGNSMSMDASDRMRRDDNRSRGGPPSRGGRGGSRGGGGSGGASAGGGMFNRGGDSRDGGGQRGGANSGGLRNSTSNSFNKNR